MPKFWRKKTLLAKVESVYGTDPVPTGAANAILAANVTLRPIEGEDVNRDVIQPFLGARGDILVNTHVALEFDVEIAGAGAVDAPPKYGPLLRACGLAETITPTTGPVDYDPVSENQESVTIYMNYDGTRHAMLGVRGTVSLSLTAAALPRYRFVVTGLFVAVADQALPTVDTSGFQTALQVSTTNTPVFTLDGLAAVLQELNVDLGSQVQYRGLVNSESVVISDRVATGSALFEAPPLATKDFFAIAIARTKVALALTHGTVAGNKVLLAAPTAEVGRPAYENSQGIVMLRTPLKFIPSAGDDEIQISTQ